MKFAIVVSTESGFRVKTKFVHTLELLQKLSEEWGKMKVSAISRGAIFATLLGLTVSQVGYSAQAAEPSGNVSIWFEDSSMSRCIAKPLIAANKNSKSKINILFKKGAADAAKTAVAGGAGPDVINTPGPTYTAQYAKAGALVPLDAYVKQFGWDKTFAPWALKLGISNGKLYSLPSELETMLLWYNKTLFDSMGLKAPKTTAELNAVADKLSAAGITPFAAGNKEWKGVNEWYISALFNGVAGPENVYKALTGTLKWNSPGFLEATTMINNWQQKGYLSGSLDRFYTKTFDGALADFASGKAAMSMEGSWKFGASLDDAFKKAGKEWAWAPFPTKSGAEQYSIGTGSSWAININSKNKDGAAQFIALMFLPSTQADLAVKCSYAPGPVKVPADLLSGLEKRKATLYTAISDAAAKGNYGYLTWSFWPAKSNQYIIDEIEKVWGKKITPAQYLDGLDAIYQTDLKAKATPPIPKR